MQSIQVERSKLWVDGSSAGEGGQEEGNNLLSLSLCNKKPELRYCVLKCAPESTLPVCPYSKPLYNKVPLLIALQGCVSPHRPRATWTENTHSRVLANTLGQSHFIYGWYPAPNFKQLSVHREKSGS